MYTFWSQEILKNSVESNLADFFKEIENKYIIN
jgi:hypothetical protein